jgi:hypothetical protein
VCLGLGCVPGDGSVSPCMACMPECLLAGMSPALLCTNTQMGLISGPIFCHLFFYLSSILFQFSHLFPEWQSLRLLAVEVRVNKTKEVRVNKTNLDSEEGMKMFSIRYCKSRPLTVFSCPLKTVIYSISRKIRLGGKVHFSLTNDSEKTKTS